MGCRLPLLEVAWLTTFSRQGKASQGTPRRGGARHGSCPLPAGRHQIEWDGHDADMRETANGVYLVVLIAGGARDYKKVTHLR